jgi:glycosyltransferase involved in cell wall biosynthesis
VLRILRDRTLQDALGAEAAHQALRFTWDTSAAEMLAVYRELVA